MKKILFLIAVILVLITSVQIWITQDRTEQKNNMEKLGKHDESAVGGSFTLTNQEGKTVHDTDFRGHVMLVSFGFTHCPDICPITVSTLSKTMELLGAKAEQVAPLFISVDPQRDTPAALKGFLNSFDKHLVGLTGTELQIKQVADAYKVYYAPSAENNAADGKGEYGVDHSGYIYMMGKDGQFLRVFPYNVPAQELAQAVETILK